MLFGVLALLSLAPYPKPVELMLWWGELVNIELMVLLVLDDGAAWPNVNDDDDNDDEEEEEEDDDGDGDEDEVGISTLCLAW